VHRSIPAVVLISAMILIAGCAAYEKAKNLDLSVRTDPQEFTLNQVNSGFDSKAVGSEDWEDHADVIKSVDEVEVSYNYDNQTGAPVTVRIYVSENPNLTKENVAGEGTLLYEKTLNEGENSVSREEIANAGVQDALEEYGGSFTVYVVTDSTADTLDVEVTEFRVYGTCSLDLT